MGFRVPPLLSFLNPIAMPDLLQINPALFEIVAEQVLQLAENLEHEFEIAYRREQNLQFVEGDASPVAHNPLEDDMHEFLIDGDPHFAPPPDTLLKQYGTVGNQHYVLRYIVEVENVFILGAIFNKCITDKALFLERSSHHKRMFPGCDCSLR